MKKGNDFIKFENRQELNAIWKALQEYTDEHKSINESDKDSIKQMINFLDSIDMNW